MTKKFDVKKEVVIHLVTEGVNKGWIRTHGLAKHGLPELEIRGVPLFMKPDAARLLNKIADYMLNDPPESVKLGDTMAVGDEAARFAFEMLPPLDEATEERWTLTDVP
jgi:hypothetical protein